MDRPLSAESEHFDFVGPLIDIGFRLSKFASLRKFVISADLAWLITAQGDAAMPFHYDGRESLKGVLNDQPYPIFWIDCNDDGDGRNPLDSIEDKVLKREPVSAEHVRELSLAFLNAVGGSVPKPFFYGEGIPPQFQPPPDFEGRLKVAQSEIGKIYEITYPKLESTENFTEKAREVADLLKDVEKSKIPS